MILCHQEHFLKNKICFDWELAAISETNGISWPRNFHRLQSRVSAVPLWGAGRESSAATGTRVLRMDRQCETQRIQLCVFGYCAISSEHSPHPSSCISLAFGGSGRACRNVVLAVAFLRGHDSAAGVGS